jgi:hypothetical protein
MHSWSTFGAWTSHKQTQTHKIHHNKNLGEATTFPFILFFVLGHRGLHPNVILSQDSQVESPKIPKIGAPATLEAYNFIF